MSRIYHTVWTKEKCFAAIRAYDKWCEDNHQKPSHVGYQTWQKHNPDAPSTNPIDRLGSWNSVRQQALSESGEIEDLVLSRNKWTCQECRQALRDYLQSGGEVTVPAYEQWRREKTAPCYNTIVTHLGGWKQALADIQDKGDKYDDHITQVAGEG